MECPGLNGLWIACPPTIDGLTATERAFFQLIGGPIVGGLVIGVVVAVTLVVLVTSDGLPVGPSMRTLPREADLAGALRHARAYRRIGVERRARHRSLVLARATRRAEPHVRPTREVPVRPLPVPTPPPPLDRAA